MPDQASGVTQKSKINMSYFQENPASSLHIQIFQSAI